jgi:hypothetical protein
MEISLNDNGTWAAVILAAAQALSAYFQLRTHKKLKELQATINSKLRIDRLEARLRKVDEKLEELSQKFPK